MVYINHELFTMRNWRKYDNLSTRKMYLPVVIQEKWDKMGEIRKGGFWLFCGVTITRTGTLTVTSTKVDPQLLLSQKNIGRTNTTRTREEPDLYVLDSRSSRRQSQNRVPPFDEVETSRTEGGQITYRNLLSSLLQFETRTSVRRSLSPVTLSIP